MKRVLILICFMITCTWANAQQKPTKEETIAFINRTVSFTVGHKIRNSTTLTSATFSYDTYIYEDHYAPELTNVHKYVDITWENMYPSFVLQEVSEPTIGSMGVCFSKKVKRVNIYSKGEGGGDAQEEYQDCMNVIIPKDKYESMKKAFLRLHEIALAENKDPFKE